MLKQLKRSASKRKQPASNRPSTSSQSEPHAIHGEQAASSARHPPHSSASSKVSSHTQQPAKTPVHKDLPALPPPQPSFLGNFPCSTVDQTGKSASASMVMHANASEQWKVHEDTEGAYVRRTYAHFDQNGVHGDGLVEGKEWTREKAARPAWASDQDTSDRRRRRVSSPPNVGTSSDKVLSQSTYVQNGRLSPSPISFQRADKDMLEVVSSPTQRDAPSSGLVNEAINASTSSLGSQSECSVPNGHATVVPIGQDDELERERKNLMTKVDRYGFFFSEGEETSNKVRPMVILSQPSLASIPRHRRRQRKAVVAQHGIPADRANFGQEEYLDGDDGQHETQDTTPLVNNVLKVRSDKDLAQRGREAIRVGKWDRMLAVQRAPGGSSFYTFLPGIMKSKKLRQRVFKGIPDRWRAAVWSALLYEGSSNTFSGHELQYKDVLGQPSSHDVQIDLDVPRTISGHVLFHTRYGQGQRALFHVLHAFSLLCSDCAYCQGMGPIVATLLVYFSPERAYGAFVEMHNDALYGLHNTFSPGFPGLVENFYAQRKLCERLCPELLLALDSKDIVASSYATKWYITLFTSVLPFSTQLRLWDAYFYQGKDLLVVAAVAILWSLRSQLLTGGFESCMNLLTGEFIPIDDDIFLNWVYHVLQRDETHKCLDSARHQYRLLMQQGQVPIL